MFRLQRPVCCICHYFQPQFTTPGQTTAHQRFFHLPAIVPPGTRLQSKVPSSHTTSHQQNQWHRQVTRLVGNHFLQNTSLQGAVDMCNDPSLPARLFPQGPGPPPPHPRILYHFLCEIIKEIFPKVLL